MEAVAKRSNGIVGAALVAGALVGFAVGAHVLLNNSVSSFGLRLGVLAATIALYSLLLVLPLCGLLYVATLAAARARPGSGLAGRRFGACLGAALALVVAIVVARLAVDPVVALAAGGDAQRSLGEFGRLLIGLVVLVSIWIALRRIGVWASIAVLTAVAFAVAGADPGVMLREGSAGAARASVEETVANFERSGPARKTAVLAFDGVDPELLAMFIRNGDMPSFARLQEQAAYSELATLALGLSPPIWTTIATGVRPGVHGVHDFFRRTVRSTPLDLSMLHHLPSGFAVATLKSALVASPLVEERAVSPTDRRVPAFWNVASMAGVRSCVVDWMATWPAERIEGVQISDRTFFWWNEGKVAFVTDAVQDAGRALRFLDTQSADMSEEDAFGLCTPAPECLRDVKAHEAAPVRVQSGEAFHLAENHFYRELAKRVFAAGDCELMVFYDHLPDMVNHVLRPGELDNLERGIVASENEQMARRLYRDADETLGMLLDTVGPDASVLVLSDHGVETLDLLGGRRVSHDRGPHGVFFFRPSAAGRTPDMKQAPSIYDIAPTVLALLGLPVPDYAEGAAIGPVVEAELGGEARVRKAAVDVERYRREQHSKAPPPGDARMEEQSRERLRALGYVD